MRPLLPIACACIVTGCFDPSAPSDTDATGTDATTTTGPAPASSTGPAPESGTTEEPDGTTTSDPDTTTTPADSGSSTTSTECEPGTYGPDCAGVCDCNDGECNDGIDGDGACTCLPGTYGASCAGVCDCGTAGCDDGASGTGLCLCPDPAGTFTVAYLPGWGGGFSASELSYMQIQSDWASYGGCEPIFVQLFQPFTADQLADTGAHVVLASNPGGGVTQYSPAEILAVRNYVMGGSAGFVSTYLLNFMNSDNSPLADLAGIDPLSHTLLDAVECLPTVDVLDAAHPLMTNLPASFDLVPAFSYAQGLDVPWADALLGSAQIVAESADQLNVVVAHETASWRGTRISTFVEYQSTPEGRQLLYNALLWSAYSPAR